MGLPIKTQNMLHTVRKDREFVLSKIQCIDLHKKNNILIDEKMVKEQSLSVWDYIPTPDMHTHTVDYKPIGTASLVSNMQSYSHIQSQLYMIHYSSQVY